MGLARRQFLTAAVVSGAAGAVAACSKGSTGSDGSISLEFWTISLQPTFNDYFNTLIADYEAANPGVTVNWTDLPYDSIEEKLITASAGGSAPDVVNLNTEFALTMAGKDAVADITAITTEEERGVYIQSLLSSAQLGDAIYAFPWYASPNIMIYNKSLFETAGIAQTPTTYDEAIALAAQMKSSTGAYLFNPPTLYNLFNEEGVDILNEDKSAATFDSADAVDVLKKFKAQTDVDNIPRTEWGSWDVELRLFETGDLAIINSSSASVARIKDEAPDVCEQIGIAMPMTGASGVSRNPLMNLVIPSKSSQQEAAARFALYVTNDANQLSFSQEAGIFPSTVAASKDPFFASDTSTIEGQASAMCAQASLTSADFSLGVEGQSTIADEVNKAYEAAIVNGDDVAASLAAAAGSVNMILGR
ncbi:MULTISPECIES: sugar ABC transporter substrate-binding protein [unclassified Actinomyces]|nr:MULTISPECIES: sugar ABC transporter substrate-binding protein [unclassified Actinomyces]MCL3776611.1 sugar ABC transporter substrate-binding protein [Actinomyces sp. AC-20-1]MCL3790106.1 sugar ABC transporter substrate-binding protein [Actinomyces sp. 187325]MCL3792408.1 sugar ABC transporter substrate-binding protein [Actinomyces sp. 186855]MCL3793477.1 sugar ABC transporter substrate-binding protein [Actinomyces sp. 217892]